MIRESLIERELRRPEPARIRNVEVNRVEALSDAVFGFAITLLVVSLEVPRTFDQLLATMRGFIAFAASFAILFLVWYHHYRFFRRYALQDATTIFLNAVLLFVVLFFVYPLKFVFSFVIDVVFLGGSFMVPGPGGKLVPIIDRGEAPLMMTVYGLGYAAVFVIFALLHLHAYRRREALGLGAEEVFDTVDNVRESLLNVAIAFLSIAIAQIGGPGWAGWAGVSYGLTGPVLALHGAWSGRRRRRLFALPPAPPTR
jgi:uncharacterized membrane protein